MPAALGKKGFYVSAPLMGAVLFMIAALIAVTIASENDSNIGIARSAELQARLQFITQAIWADSYDVLLQQDFEVLTKNFLEEEYFDINTNEPWRQSLRSNLVNYYVDEMGDSLSLDIEAYASAYSDMPGMDKCEVVRGGESISSASLEDSLDPNDESILARAGSFGESLNCKSRDPQGEVTIDIAGRYYRINIRVPNLYESAKTVLSTARAGIDGNLVDIQEPIASWEGPRWIIVKKVDNTPAEAGDITLDNLVDAWVGIMGWFSDRVISIANIRIQDEGRVGISVKEFEARGMDGEEYSLDDLFVSCVEEQVGNYRNCMPFRVLVGLGKEDCIIGEKPESTVDALYSLSEFSLKCGVGNCPRAMWDVMKDIIEPLGYACVDYYGAVDTVYPVCKKWDAKSRETLFRGVMKDDDPEYMITGQTESLFRFKDQHSNVNVDELRENLLKCEGDNNDTKRYKENVKRLLERTKVVMGSGQTIDSPLITWMDKGSVLSGLTNPDLNDIYKNIYGQGVLPMPCLGGGIRPKGECDKQENQGNPRMEIRVNWDETRENCINRINDLCDKLHGVIADPTYTETFCKNLFPEGQGGGSKGKLHCAGKDPIDVKIDLLALEWRG